MTSEMTREHLEAAVSNAAVKWCGEKERETSLDDITYFESNWRWMPGFKARVDAEVTAMIEAKLESRHE
jgi:hypothetical protein